MIDQQVTSYITTERARGVRDEDIRTALLASGWKEEDVSLALAAPLAASAAPLHGGAATGGGSLPGAVSLLKQAWDIYRVRFATLIGITFIPVLLWAAVFAVILGGALGLAVFSTFVSMSGGPLGFLLPILLALTVLLAIIVIQFWSHVAVLIAIRDHGENLAITEAYRRGWKKIGAYAWVSLLVGVIVLGGLMLFFVPGVIFIVWFYTAVFVLIAEDVRGMDALLRARAYVKGRWWGVLWRLIFICIVTIAVTYIPPAIVSGLGIPYADQALQVLLGLVMGPLTTIYGFMLYRALSESAQTPIAPATRGQKATFITIGVVGFLLIPAILAGVVLGSLGTARERSRDAKRISDIGQLQFAEVLYYDTNQHYSVSLDELAAAHLLPSIPIDPLGNKPYSYAMTHGGQGYVLGASLTNSDSPALATDSDAMDVPFNTADSIGCSGEFGRHCYDIEVTPLNNGITYPGDSKGATQQGTLP